MTAGPTQLELGVYAPPRPERRDDWRAWARRDRQLFEALLEARESGKTPLIERATRAHRENLHKMPPAAARRRRRDGGVRR